MNVLSIPSTKASVARRTAWVLAAALPFCAAPAFAGLPAPVGFSDDFESYGLGSLHGIGGWAGWDNTAGATANVTDAQAASGAQSLEYLPGSDLVQIFEGATEGLWVFSVNVYVPTGHTGQSFVILLNTYAHGGPYNWSSQVVIENGNVTSAGGTDIPGGGAAVPVTFDAWVPLRFEIDLVANTQSIIYGDQLVQAMAWNATGALRIHAVDLFSNNGSTIYVDDVVLEPVVPVTNVAPTGIAKQTSQLGGFAPSLAINGNLGDFTHTASGNGGLGAAVWELDLGQNLALREIVVHNRSSCCGSRLRDVVVSVHDAPYILDGGLGDPIGEDGVWGEALYQSGLLNPENVLGGGVINVGPANLPVDLLGETGAPVTGRYVRVTRLPDEDLSGSGGEGNADEGTVLSLGEVQVYVATEDLAPSILTQPQGATVASGACHRFTVALFNADDAESITYQWRKDGEDLVGETDDNLFVSGLTPADAGAYSVVVDVDGTILVSDDAILEVTQPNLAVGGTASQINVAFGGSPERAIDGNTSGLFGSNSITHTDNTEGAWWEVELAGVSTISRVVVWNRTECCGERLSNFRLSVLDEAREEVFGEDLFTDLTFPAVNVEVEIGDVEGLFVRLERLGPDAAGNNFLSLSEVQVFGEGPPLPPDPNLARLCGAVVSQSTTLGGFTPNLAINGNRSDFTHTQGTDSAATWQIEFPEEVEVGFISLFNRTSCCGSRLRDVVVEVIDAEGAVQYESPLLNPENELGAFPNGPARLDIDLQFGGVGVVPAKIVRIHRVSDPDLSGSGGQGNTDEANVLSLGEVEIYAPVDCGGTGDVHCDGLTVEGPEDAGPGTYTVTVAATDDTGDEISYELMAEEAGGAVVHLGPQATGVFTLRLGLGSWTITSSVDDSVICPTEGEDSVCSTTVDVVCDEGNLAPFGVASQSTTGFGGDASRGNDCNPDGVYNNGSVTHTATDDPAPSWQVDLLEEYPIDRVVIWGRSDCCSNRLTNFHVSILDAAGAEVFGEDFFTDGTSPDPAAGGFVVATGNAVGQVVRIARLGAPEDFPGQYFLSLSEVEVYEGVDACLGTGDVHCDGLTVEGPADGGPGSYTVTVAATDDSGDEISYALSAQEAGGEVIDLGPQASNVFALDLGVGSWTITTHVDDDLECPTEGEDASCSTTIEVSDVATSGPFIRADSNSDSKVDISDGVFTLNWLFLGGPEPGCLAAANANLDDRIDLSDAVYSLNFLFLGGPAPGAPFPDCGVSEGEVDVSIGCETPNPGCI